MNAQDAIGMLGNAEEINGRIMSIVVEVEQFSNETEATLAQLLGSHNDQVGIFAQASHRLEACKRLSAQLGAEMHAAREYLASLT